MEHQKSIFSFYYLLYPSVFLGPFGGNTVLALIIPLKEFFNADISFIATSITIYMIPFAFFQLFSGAFSDIYRRKRIILFGLFTFSLASPFCASSNNTGLFLGARALQGLGSAFIAPTIMAIIGDVFSYKERGEDNGRIWCINNRWNSNRSLSWWIFCTNRLATCIPDVIHLLWTAWLCLPLLFRCFRCL